MISQNYDKHPDTYKAGIKKSYLGGLNIIEKNSGTGSVLTDMIKQVGKKVAYTNLDA